MINCKHLHTCPNLRDIDKFFTSNDKKGMIIKKIDKHLTLWKFDTSMVTVTSQGNKTLIYFMAVDISATLILLIYIDL